jgi:hypothetical protein
MGGEASESAALSACDRGGLKPWRLAGVRRPSVATGSRASSATSKNCDLGVAVVCVSDKYGGVQPRSKATASTRNVLGHLTTKENWVMMGFSITRSNGTEMRHRVIMFEPRSPIILTPPFITASTTSASA